MSRKFDPESGQVFTQYAVSARQASPLQWLLQTRPGAEELSACSDKQTGLSLREICMRTLLHNVSNLEAEALQGVPWEFAKRIWERMRDERVDNVKIWKAFATAYGEDFSTSYGHYEAPILPHHQLLSALPYASAINRAWLTVLSIRGIQLTQRHWMEIGRMPNLVALFVHGYESCLDLRTVRAWAISAREGSAFPELRILATWGECIEVDPSYFDHLAELPKLERVGLNLRLSNDQIYSSGWRKSKRSTAQTGVEDRTSMADALAALRDNAIRSKPILNVLSASYDRSLQRPSIRHRNWYERFRKKSRNREQHDNLVQGGNGSGTKQCQVRAGKKRSLYSMLETF